MFAVSQSVEISGQLHMIKTNPSSISVATSFETSGYTPSDPGVCFRMYTEDQARKLGVVGWVRNTRRGTVDGQVQGKAELVESMKHWLSKVGSPSSRIHQAHFSNEKEITKLEFGNFNTRH
ncbi:acylphosphatase-2-like isoform X1 [Leucoraja erinacea]|uniref:acylphosphatase-2-like isoform X1 n=2 Tax=Leucoraja erinaceus TaxID=7782 RepID=UPI002458D26D|nr:acylphosphatase-2-like isoform X1 [Leucoraja erinacea]